MEMLFYNVNGDGGTELFAINIDQATVGAQAECCCFKHAGTPISRS